MSTRDATPTREPLARRLEASAREEMTCDSCDPHPWASLRGSPCGGEGEEDRGVRRDGVRDEGAGGDSQDDGGEEISEGGGERPARWEACSSGPEIPEDSACFVDLEVGLEAEERPNLPESPERSTPPGRERNAGVEAPVIYGTEERVDSRCTSGRGPRPIETEATKGLAKMKEDPIDSTRGARVSAPLACDDMHTSRGDPSCHRDPGWLYVGPWTLDAYRDRPDASDPSLDAPTESGTRGEEKAPSEARAVTVVARDVTSGVPRCGWRLGSPVLALDAAAATRAALGTPTSVPVTGVLLALFDGLGLDAADLLAALLAEHRLHPEDLAAVAPLALTPWTAHTHSLSHELANEGSASHLREFAGAAAPPSSRFPPGDALRVPFLLAADASLRR